MAKGTKLELSLGGAWDEGWALVDEASSVKEPELLDPAKHQLYFKREKRRGKVVTLVGPLHVTPQMAQELLCGLKKTLCCGGTFNAPWLELQGALEEKARTELEQRGYRFKR